MLIPTEEENPIPIVTDIEPIEEHTADSPFCDDMTCPCHEDQEAIAETAEQVTGGLLTPSEADRYYRGKTL